MKIKTRFHGEVEIKSNELWHFVSPILGFENEPYFATFPLEEGLPFIWMQSVQTEMLGFYLISPWSVRPDYEFELEPEQLTLLGVESAEDVDVYCIVTIPEDFSKSTLNLLAPIVVNRKTSQVSQLVLMDAEYSIQHPLFEGVNSTC